MIMAVPKGIFPQEYIRYKGHKHTNQRKAVIATLPLLRVHLMNHRQSPSPARYNNTNTLQQAMFIRGHTHAIRNLVPLDFANIPKHTRFMKKLHLHRYKGIWVYFAKSSGTGFRAGMSVPTDEHGLL
jgi:hypothetical protein